MQNEQVLLHPTLMDTQAANTESRLEGKLEGNVSSASRISTWDSSRTRARSNKTGREPILWVPNTTSTYGACCTIVSRSYCARHPPTAIRSEERRVGKELRYQE